MSRNFRNVNKKGQGIVESIFSVGVLGLILTGVVILVVMTLSSKKTSFDRKKAVELGEIVMEEIVANSINDKESFWSLANVSETENPDFKDYHYTVTYTPISGNPAYPNCGVGGINCAEVEVRVSWQGKNAETLIFNRFFSRE
jgi:Tfp pilus assembly protein PilV